MKPPYQKRWWHDGDVWEAAVAVVVMVAVAVACWWWGA